MKNINSNKLYYIKRPITRVEPRSSLSNSSNTVMVISTKSKQKSIKAGLKVNNVKPRITINKVIKRQGVHPALSKLPDLPLPT